MYRVRSIILMSVLLCLSGCFANKKLYIDIYPNQSLNLSDNKKSLPVTLKIYQLCEDRNFKKATFQALWKDDLKTLDGNYLDKQQVNILPGQFETIALNRQKDAKVLGIVAGFREQDELNWRLIKPISSSIFKNRTKIVLKNSKISEKES